MGVPELWDGVGMLVLVALLSIVWHGLRWFSSIHLLKLAQEVGPESVLP